MTTVEEHICKNASMYPNKPAVICNSKSVTYAELLQLIQERAKEFKNKGITQKGYYVFRSSQSIQFVVDYFATHLAGCVAVPLEKDAPEGRVSELENSLKDVSFPKDTADILFTTGTTGKSKGVVVSNKAIIANAENLIDAHQYTNDLNFIICGPLNHLGCLSKIFPTMVMGGTLHILEDMKNANIFFEVLEQEGKFATFMVPASIRMLLQIHKSRLAKHGNKIDFIETGAAPITLADMKNLSEILPATRLFNTYASTETGIVATYNFNCKNRSSGCVGKALKNSSLFITEHGQVACKGKTLMSGYINEPKLTSEILHDNTVYTSDLGKIDENGMLFLLGRKDDIINVGGYKIEPNEVEEVAMKYPNVSDCICIGAVHPIIGTVLKLLVVMKDNAELKKKDLYKFIGENLESYKVPFYYEKVDKIERTYNGKINRKFYC